MSAGLVITIIPVFNGERFVGDALESALAQDYEPHEVIVVDDGSTDGTADVAARFPDVSYIHQDNGGDAAARNTGIVAARGEFICLLDADDTMAPGRLTRQVGHLVEHPEVGCVLGRQEVVVESGAELPSWVRESDHSATGSEVPDEDYYPPPTLVARRSVFDAVGLYDPSFRVASDVDWLFRVREAGVEIATLDEVVIRRRVHDANLTLDDRTAREEVFRVFKARIERRRRA